MIQLFGVAFLGLGVVAGFFLTRSLLKALQSNSWPKTSGKILQAGLKRVEVSDNSREGHAATQVDYSYTYTVGDKKFTGSRVTFSDRMVKTGGSLHALINELRDGDDVRVSYDPEDPSTSVLKPGPSIYNFTPFITVFLILSVGVGLCFYSEELLSHLK